MKGVHKPFDKTDYIKFDGPAKLAMKVHLELSGYKVTVPPENYGADLYSELGKIKIYHEVEVSQGWKEKEHPFWKGSIPERKKRLADMHINEPLYFWMLRLDLHRALVFPSFRLRPEFLIEVPNKKIRKGEYFYRIPKLYGKEFDLLCK
ncbi:MAG: hypothetical protein JRE23_03340 [Deltaproteobacteria bacterium]|nr:hypothetical protein [Deltaproteobacteria bacterium]